MQVTDNRVVVQDLQSGRHREVGRNSKSCLSLWNPRFADANTILVDTRGYEVPTIHHHGACLIDVVSGRMVTVAQRSECVVPIGAGRHAGQFYVADLGFVFGQGIFERYRVLDRFGTPVRSFADDPFRAPRRSGVIDPPNADGAIGWMELVGCPDALPSQQLAAVTSKW